MTVYVPVGVDLVVETVSVTVLDPPDERVTLDALRETVGPPVTVGEIDTPPTLKGTCT